MKKIVLFLLILGFVTFSPNNAGAVCQKSYAANSNHAAAQGGFLAACSIALVVSGVYTEGTERTVLTSCLGGIQGFVGGFSGVLSLTSPVVWVHDRRMIKLLNEAEHFHSTKQLDQIAVAEHAFNSFKWGEGPKDLEEMLTLIHFGNHTDLFCPETHAARPFKKRSILPWGTIRKMFIDGTLEQKKNDLERQQFHNRFERRLTAS